MKNDNTEVVCLFCDEGGHIGELVKQALISFILAEIAGNSQQEAFGGTHK